MEDEYGLDPQDGDGTADPPAPANPPADGERRYPQRARRPPDRFSRINPGRMLWGRGHM